MDVGQMVVGLFVKKRSGLREKTASKLPATG